MNKTYKYTLPKGMEVEKTNVRVENGQILVDVELKDKFDPKDGDFCIDIDGDIFIAHITDVVYENSIKVYIGTNRKFGNLLYTDGLVSRKGCRYATPEEKSAFLERIEKELHKRWNPDKKCLEDVYVPKFGDIVKVVAPRKAERNYMICIFPDKEIPKEQTNNFYDIANVSRNLSLSNSCGFVLDQTIVPASESEKQELFDKLAEVGKRWNPDRKQLEDIRWEPKEGESYFFVNSYGGISNTIRNTACDSFIVGIGNAFKTEEAAKPYADQIKEIFKNSKAE